MMMLEQFTRNTVNIYMCECVLNWYSESEEIKWIQLMRIYFDYSMSFSSKIISEIILNYFQRNIWQVKFCSSGGNEKFTAWAWFIQNVIFNFLTEASSAKIPETFIYLKIFFYWNFESFFQVGSKMMNKWEVKPHVFVSLESSHLIKLMSNYPPHSHEVVKYSQVLAVRSSITYRVKKEKIIILHSVRSFGDIIFELNSRRCTHICGFDLRTWTWHHLLFVFSLHSRQKEHKSSILIHKQLCFVTTNLKTFIWQFYVTDLFDL
jgi:hypothetical protein